VVGHPNFCGIHFTYDTYDISNKLSDPSLRQACPLCKPKPYKLYKLYCTSEAPVVHKQPAGILQAPACALLDQGERPQLTAGICAIVVNTCMVKRKRGDTPHDKQAW